MPQKCNAICPQGCKDCLPCPRGVNIPARLDVMAKLHDQLLTEENAKRKYRAIREEEAAYHGGGLCSECGACFHRCPKKHNIPALLKVIDNSLVQSIKRL